jgi:GTPase involved in cell partitioning and DNA repair
MIPVDAEDPQAEYERIRAELEAYSVDLATTPFVVGLSKTDMLGPDDPVPTVIADNALGVFPFSAIARKGLPELLEKLWEARDAVTAEERGSSPDEWWTP